MRIIARHSLCLAAALGATAIMGSASAQTGQVSLFIYQIDTKCPSLGYKASGNALPLTGELHRGLEVYRGSVLRSAQAAFTTNSDALRTFVKGMGIQPHGQDTDCPDRPNPPAKGASSPGGEFENGATEFQKKSASQTETK